MMNHGTHGHDTSHESHSAAPTDRPSVHGMLMVGEETVYLSHLPMFMSPHDYQAILEVTLTNKGSNPQAIYTNDRKTTGEKIYTFVPERFVLTDLVSPDPKHPHRSSFKGTPFRGHFERGGEALPIAAAGNPPTVGAKVTRVVHFRKFDPEADQLPQLAYLLFGKGKELFLGHLITRPPDFDQILSVKVAGHEFTDEQLRQGVHVTFPGRANSPDARIKEGEKVSGQIQLAGENDPETLAVQLEAGLEFYFEAGELETAM
jgi:hypothetical protein